MSARDSVTVALVGDVMLERSLAELGTAAGAALSKVVDQLRAADIVIGNLEMPLSRRGSPMLKHSNLRSDPDRIRDVLDLGVHAVSLANNHLMDYGPQALLDTLNACDRAGVSRCGAGANIGDALAPACLEANGQRVALFSVSCTLPPGSEATATDPGIAPIRIRMSFETDTNLLAEQPGTMPIVHTWTRQEDQDAVLARVQSAANDMPVIVAIHWGVPSYWLSPYQGLLAEYQQALGRALIDAGAALVLGHHSHSLHGVEVYNGCAIFYSVGNFAFERPRAFMEPESVIVYAVLTPHGITHIQVAPLIIDERGLPALATGDDEERVFALLQSRSAPFGTGFRREGSNLAVLLA